MTARIRSVKDHNDGLQNIHLDFSNSDKHCNGFKCPPRGLNHYITSHYIVLHCIAGRCRVSRDPPSPCQRPGIIFNQLFPTLKRHVEKMHNNLPISILAPSREVAKKTINLSTHCFPYLMSHKSNIYSRIITLFHLATFIVNLTLIQLTIPDYCFG